MLIIGQLREVYRDPFRRRATETFGRHNYGSNTTLPFSLTLPQMATTFNSWCKILCLPVPGSTKYPKREPAVHHIGSNASENYYESLSDNDCD